MYGPFNFQNRPTARSTASRENQECMDGGQKSNDRANCKRQLTLKVRGERRLRGIVRSQKNQTIAQLTIQLNDCASSIVIHGLCNTRFTVWVSGADDLPEYHC
ncbi:hypothetical protein TNCV_1769331 [Trichonephila clavipes]|nr:hypothetical protein TNCV_1769331 [Trichonephila clavipes]